MSAEGPRDGADGRRGTDERLLAEAAAWHDALARDDADWDGYVDWLEADDRHREAFDAVALVGRAVDDHADVLRGLAGADGTAEAPDRAERVGRAPAYPPGFPRRRYRFLGAAAAAALAAVAAAVALVVVRPSDPPGGNDVLRRSGDRAAHFSLPGGVDVDLAPRTTLALRGGDPERLALLGGEAFFRVAHDPRRTLSVEAGGAAIRDIGTSFGVNLSPAFLLVSVSEGRVGLAPSGSSPLDVAAGQRYTLDRGTGRGTVGRVASAGVGSWRRGQLTYADVPLPVVAADVARFTGTRIDLDPALAGRSFSGALRIGEGTQPARLLADIMGVSYEERDGGVRLSAARR